MELKLSRKILVSLVVIGLTATAAAGGTLAMFSDMETSNGNTFAAEQMDLVLSDWNEKDQNGITQTWYFKDVKPGDALAGEMVVDDLGELENTEINISFSVEERDPGFESGNNEESDTLNGAQGMSEKFKVLYIYYTGAYVHVNDFTDVNGNGYIDLDDLDEPVNEQVLTGLPGPVTGERTFLMDFKLPESVGNDYQGDEVAMNVTATLTQKPMN